MKKNSLLLRALGTILSLCFMAAAASPTAYATTPEQEAVLATGQRSMNNPDGVFTTPEALTSPRLLHPETRQAAGMIVGNSLQQLFLGNADMDAVGRILAYAPIVKEDELPPLDIGEDLLNYLLHMLQIGSRNVYIALRETEKPGVYQIITLFSTRAGEVYYVPQGIEYDAVSGWIYGTGGDGLLSIGFDYNVLKYMARATPNAWPSVTGYSILVDLLTPVALTYLDTLRFPFTHQGQEWMIQFWKGSYGPSNGAEIGIYEKPGLFVFGQPLHWNAASDNMLDISMQLYQKDMLFFDYGTQRTWWTGGFKYGNAFSTPLVPARQLRLTGTILFEDQAMLDAFLVSFEKNKTAIMIGSAEGLLFRFDWQAG